LYLFDYEREPGVGFSHAQDLNYVFGFNFYDHWGNATDENDTRMAEQYTQYFVNFAKTGQPTVPGSGDVPWRPMTSPDGTNYYSITLEPANKLQFYLEPIRFWTQTAPAIIDGAVYEAMALGLGAPVDATPIVNLANLPLGILPPDATQIPSTSPVNSGIEYEIGFYILLAILIVILVSIIINAIAGCCRQQNAATDKVEDGRVPNEHTPLVAKTASKSHTRAQEQPTVHPSTSTVTTAGENHKQ
jgi:hypothetical protein